MKINNSILSKRTNMAIGCAIFGSLLLAVSASSILGEPYTFSSVYSNDSINIEKYQNDLPQLINNYEDVLSFNDEINYQYVNTNDVYVYSTPNDEGEIIDTLKYADFIKKLSMDNSISSGWICVDHNGIVGYIHQEYATSDFILIESSGEYYVNDGAIAYKSINNKNEYIQPKFNSTVKRNFYNERWSVCEINGEKYYILTKDLSETKHFIEEEKTMYIENDDVVIYSAPEITSETIVDTISFSSEDEVSVSMYNDDVIGIVVDNDTYYVNADALVPYKTITSFDCIGAPYNNNFDNLDVINRLNTYYDKSIADSFNIGNKGAKELVNNYLNKARENARPGATPAEIIYYGYLDIMENASYHYNTYAYLVSGAYDGLCDNSGSYRAVSLMDRNIKMGACENYAAAMTAMLRTLGFDAEIVGGNGAGSGSYGHYWCQVGNLIFDAQVDDSSETYGLRFGRTSDELEALGYSGYYVQETKDTSSKLELYNTFT